MRDIAVSPFCGRLRIDRGCIQPQPAVHAKRRAQVPGVLDGGDECGDAATAHAGPNTAATPTFDNHPSNHALGRIPSALAKARP